MADSPITVLSLCSGIGMLDEGVSLGIENITGRRAVVVGFGEREAYAASILLARMADKAMEPAPIFVGNFEDADWGWFAGAVDCIVAGFPCQPWSAAGKQAGTDDERWLWPAIVSLISKVEPSLIFLENVPGLVSGGGLEFVLADLAAIGFDAEWLSLAAAEVGASHERERIFILAQHQSRGRGILRQSSECGGLFGGGAVKAWQTPKAGEEDSGSGMNSRGEEKLKAQALNWSTPQARDKAPGAGSTDRGGRHRDLNRESEKWMTPVANDDNKTPEAHLAMKARMPGGPRSTITSLNVQSQVWPTPVVTDASGYARTSPDVATATHHQGTSLADAISAWPTPAARDHKGENSEQHALVTGGGRKHMDQLANFVAHSPQAHQIQGGEQSSETNRGSRQRLNPAFVGWLQGNPWWWTSPVPISCAASEIKLWRSKQALLLSSLLEGLE